MNCCLHTQARSWNWLCQTPPDLLWAASPVHPQHPAPVRRKRKPGAERQREERQREKWNVLFITKRYKIFFQSKTISTQHPSTWLLQCFQSYHMIFISRWSSAVSSIKKEQMSSRFHSAQVKVKNCLITTSADEAKVRWFKAPQLGRFLGFFFNLFECYC